MPPNLYVKVTHVTCFTIARNSKFVFMKLGTNFVQQMVTFTYKALVWNFMMGAVTRS